MALVTVLPISPVVELSALCSCASVQDTPYGGMIDGARPEEITKQRLTNVETRPMDRMPHSQDCKMRITRHLELASDRQGVVGAYQCTSRYFQLNAL
jgi:hypothetical protein